MLLGRICSIGRCDEHNSTLKVLRSFSEIALSVQNFVFGSDVINGTFLSSKDRVNKMFSELKEMRKGLIVHPFKQSSFSVVSLSTPLDRGSVKVAV